MPAVEIQVLYKYNKYKCKYLNDSDRSVISLKISINSKDVFKVQYYLSPKIVLYLKNETFSLEIINNKK